MQICALMQIPESRVIGCHVSREELIYLDEPSLLICFAELPKMSDFKAAAQSERPGRALLFCFISPRFENLLQRRPELYRLYHPLKVTESNIP